MTVVFIGSIRAAPNSAFLSFLSAPLVLGAPGFIFHLGNPHRSPIPTNALVVALCVCGVDGAGKYGWDGIFFLIFAHTEEEYML